MGKKLYITRDEFDAGIKRFDAELHRIRAAQLELEANSTASPVQESRRRKPATAGGASIAAQAKSPYGRRRKGKGPDTHQQKRGTRV